MIHPLNIDEKINKNQIGEKAYHLIELNRIGVNVPFGYFLPIEYHQEYLAGKKISEMEIEFEKLKASEIMVRSSAVGEDGKEQSFAGQLESYRVLNNHDDILQAIEKCWDSMKNSRVQTYDLENKLESMGVIVQEMIDPDYAGVYFSVSPNNPDLELIEYVPGHCEKLVQGEVTPETFYSDGDQTNLPFNFLKLQEICHKIRDYFKEEQDIEWLVKDNVFYIVQARPITKIEKKVRWSSTNVNENYPNKLSPLLYSIARRSYYHYFKNLAQKLGLDPKSEDEFLFYNTIGTWGERMYYNMSHIRGVIGISPLAGMLNISFDNFVGYQKGKKEESETHSIFGVLSFLLRSLWHFIRLPGHVRFIEQNVYRYYERENKKENLASLYHHFLDLRFNKWFHASFADFFAMLTHGALGKFLTKLKFDQGVHNQLIQSIPGLVSNQPIFDLWSLRELIKREEQMMFFVESSSDSILKKLETKEFSKIKEKMDSYLNRWGVRCTGELTFLDDNYIEDKNSFVAMLQMYLKSSDVNPKEQFNKKHQEQLIILKDVRRKIIKKKIFLGPIYVFVLQLLVTATMKSIAARERVRLQQARMYFKFKQVCLELGQLLEEKGILKSKRDIFFLEYDEISCVLNNEEISSEYIQKIIQARHNRGEQAVEFPENILSGVHKWDNTFYDQDLTVNSDMQGLPACGGKIKARAVVLDSIHEIDKLQKGDILVTKQTDPGWICAFPLISGLVVERGGMLSHGAIVAREFGIPAVVGVKGITHKIKTNDIIEVDGNNGVINV